MKERGNKRTTKRSEAVREPETNRENEEQGSDEASEGTEGKKEICCGSHTDLPAV